MPGRIHGNTGEATVFLGRPGSLLWGRRTPTFIFLIRGGGRTEGGSDSAPTTKGKRKLTQDAMNNDCRRLGGPGERGKQRPAETQIERTRSVQRARSPLTKRREPTRDNMGWTGARMCLLIKSLWRPTELLVKDNR